LIGGALLGAPVACGLSTQDRSIADGGGNGFGAAANAGGTGGHSDGGSVLLPLRFVCGNGQLEGVEQCDDSNRAGGDGCSEVCEIEPGATCPSVGPCVPPRCGDGILFVPEQCDDGNLEAGDGCSPDCFNEEGWRCPGLGVPCRPICGDRLVRGDEACDDGNTTSHDGCSRSCRLECTAQGDGGAGGEGGAGSPATPCAPTCGNGIVEADEDCDLGTLGNDAHYGGCKPDCMFAAYCGDGVVDAGSTETSEACDDGTNASTYGVKGGCGAGCRSTPYCGDGVIDVEDGETCDDGDRNGLAHCKAGCSVK
jgi:cysteine-rich repeat protein